MNRELLMCATAFVDFMLYRVVEQPYLGLTMKISEYCFKPEEPACNFPPVSVGALFIATMMNTIRWYVLLKVLSSYVTIYKV